MSTVLQLRPVEYNLKSNDLKQVGFIAQEVKKLIPEVVTGNEGDIEKGVKLFSIVNNTQTRTFMKSEWKGMELVDNKYYPKGYKFN